MEIIGKELLACLAAEPGAVRRESDFHPGLLRMREYIEEPLMERWLSHDMEGHLLAHLVLAQFGYQPLGESGVHKSNRAVH